jgi:hypothetical protein
MCCLADGRIMISMLGDDKGNAPGGFLLMDDKFDEHLGSQARREEIQLLLLAVASSWAVEPWCWRRCW